MPEIVGSAYVRIKAITDGVAGDIQKGLDKGAGDIDMKPAGKKMASGLSSGIDEGIKGEEGKISGGIKDTVGKAADKAEGDDKGWKFGQRFANRMYLAMEAAGDSNKSDFLKPLTKKLDKFQKATKVPRIALAGMFGSPAIGGAVKTLGDYVGALTAQVGFLGQAAIGASGAIAGALGGAALAAGPLLLAFKTASPALDLFQAKAKVFADIWKDVGESTQTYLLPALTDAMRESTKLVPMFQDFGSEVGFVGGNLAKMAVGMLTSTQMMAPLHNILDNSVGLFGTFGQAAISALRGLIEMFSAVMPVARRFADSIKDMADRFAFTTTVKARSGELTETFDKWYDRAEQVGRSMSNLLKAVLNVFKQGGDAATPFFDHFESFTKRWLDFTRSAEGQDKIAKFFAGAIPVAQEVNALLKDIIGWILTPALSGKNDGLIQFFEMMRTVVLPAIKQIGASLSGQLTASLAGFTQSIAEFLQATASGNTLQAFFKVLSNVLEVLTTIVEIPGMSEFIGVLLSLMGAFKAITVVANPFIKVMGTIASSIAGLAKTADVTAFKAALKAFGEGDGSLGQVSKTAGTLMAGLVNPVTIGFAAITAAVLGGIAIWTAYSTNQKRTAREIKQFQADILDGGSAIDTLSKSYKNILTTRDSFDESLKKTGFTIQQVSGFVENHVGDMSKLKQAWRDGNENLIDFGSDVLGLSDSLLEVDTETGKFTHTWKDFQEGLQKSKAFGKEIPESLRPWVTELFRLGTQTDIDANALREFVDGAGELDLSAVASSQSIAKFAENFYKLGETAGVSVNALNNAHDAMTAEHGLQAQEDAIQRVIAEYPKLAEAAGVPMETIKKVTEDVNSQFADLISKLEELRGGQADADQSARDYTIAFEDLTKAWEDGKQSMKGSAGETAKAENELARLVETGKKAAEGQITWDKTGKASTDTLHQLADRVRELATQEGLGTEETNALLDSWGLLSDEEINAEVTIDTTKAVKSADELKKELTEFPGISEPLKAHIETLLADGGPGSLAEATTLLDNWKNLHAARALPLTVDVNTLEGSAKVMDLLGWTSKQTGFVTIDGKSVKAEDAIKVATDIANGSVGTIAIEGDTDGALETTEGLLLHVDESTGEISVTANPDPANTTTDHWAQVTVPEKPDAIHGVGADTEPGDKTIDQWVEELRRKRIAEITVKAIVNFQSNGSVLLPDGRHVSIGQAEKGDIGTTVQVGSGTATTQTTTASMAAATAATATMNAVRGTIAAGRAAGMRLMGAGVSSLRAPRVSTFSPTGSAGIAVASNAMGEVNPSKTIDVPGAAAASDPVLHITVKIGERDITEIVDVQMNQRMGQLATALRRAS